MKLFFSSVFFILLTLCSSWLFASELDLRLYVLNVGQGSGNVVLCPKKKTDDSQEVFVHDLGNTSERSDIAYENAKNKLKDLGVETIDHLFISHPHVDHYSILKKLIDKGKIKKVRYLYIPKGSQPGGKRYASFINAVEAAGAKGRIRELDYHEEFSFDCGAAKVDFVGRYIIERDKNSMSLVVKMSFQGKSILFTGDATTKSKEDILQYRGATKKMDLQSDVVLISHHGSSTGLSSGWIKKIKPKHLIVSAAFNGYGLPRCSVLEDWLRDDSGKPLYERPSKAANRISCWDPVNKKWDYIAPSPGAGRALYHTNPDQAQLQSDMSNPSARNYEVILPAGSKPLIIHAEKMPLTARYDASQGSIEEEARHFLDFFNEYFLDDQCVCEFFIEALSERQQGYWHEIASYANLDKYSSLVGGSNTSLFYEVKRLFDLYYFLHHPVALSYPDIANGVFLGGEAYLDGVYPELVAALAPLSEPPAKPASRPGGPSKQVIGESKPSAPPKPRTPKPLKVDKLIDRAKKYKKTELLKLCARSVQTSKEVSADLRDALWWWGGNAGGVPVR